MSNESMILCLAKENSSLSEFLKRMQSLGFNLKNGAQLSSFNMESLTEAPQVILIEVNGSQWPESMEEKLQLLKSNYPESKRILIITDHSPLSATEALSKGASEVYHFPFDEEFLIAELFESVPIQLDSEKLSLDLMLHVNILDLAVNKTLAFDLYIVLPSNKKILLYLKKDTPLEEKTFNKFTTNRDFKLYIKRTDAQLYLKESSKVLSDIQKNPSLDEPSKALKTQGEIKKLMGNFFSDDSSDEQENRQLLENARRVLAQLSDESGSKESLQEAALQLAGENMTNYTHAKNVGTYCALFGMLLGINEPESLYLGGFLHDIGMGDLPSHLLTQDESEMDEDEMAQFKLHPGNGRIAMNEKKVEFTDNIISMVSHHHECPDGSGFPYGLKAEDITDYAKICAFADEFDRLTSVRMGYKTLSPKHALESLAGHNGEAAHSCYSEDFHGTLINELLADPGSLNPAAIPTATSTVTTTDPPIEVKGGSQEPDSKITVNGKLNVKKDDPITVAGGADEAEESMTKSGSTTVRDGDLEVEHLKPEVIDEDININGTTVVEPDNTVAITSNFAAPIEEEILVKGSKQLEDEDVIKVKGNSEVSQNSDKIEVSGDPSNDSGDDNIHVKGGSFEPENETVHVKGSQGTSSDEAAQTVAGHQTTNSIEHPDDTIHVKRLSKNEDKDEDENKIEAASELSKDPDALNTNFRDDKGLTILMKLCAASEPEVIEKLIQQGADPKAKDFQGVTALMYAVKADNLGVTKVLVQNGAQVRVVDSQGVYTLIHAIQSKATQTTLFLLDQDADPDLRFKGQTALMLASRNGDLEVVKKIIEMGGKISLKDRQGATAVSYAAKGKHNHVIAYFKTILTGAADKNKKVA